MADDTTLVGSFSNVPSGSRLSDCTPSEVCTLGRGDYIHSHELLGPTYVVSIHQNTSSFLFCVRNMYM